MFIARGRIRKHSTPLGSQDIFGMIVSTNMQSRRDSKIGGNKGRSIGSLSKLPLVAFPARLHLRHELKESRIFADRVEEQVARKERVAREALGDRHSQPLQGFLTLATQRVNPGDIVCVVMIA